MSLGKLEEKFPPAMRESYKQLYGSNKYSNEESVNEDEKVIESDAKNY